MKALGIVVDVDEALGFATGYDEVPVVFYGYGYGVRGLLRRRLGRRSATAPARIRARPARRPR